VSCPEVVHAGFEYVVVLLTSGAIVAERVFFTGIFDDAFTDYLFDLVEQTRHMQDETFNYGVIKLIVSSSEIICNSLLTVTKVSLNEQFMVAALPDGPANVPNAKANDISESKNRVLRVLMRRLGSSKTFGENMIFMLNRARMWSDAALRYLNSFVCRTNARGFMHATPGAQDSLRPFYDQRHLGILLH
jgi:hypothetical protein